MQAADHSGAVQNGKRRSQASPTSGRALQMAAQPPIR